MTYLSEVLADAPDHFWRMADPGGFMCHDLGSAAHTITTGTIPSLPYTGPNSDGGSFAVSGVGGARSLDGITLPSPRTLEAWYYPIIVPASVYIIAFDGNSANQWALSTDANSKLAGSVNGTNVIGSTAITKEHWHHCVMTYDGTNCRVYLDALLVGGPTAIGAPANVNRQFWVGSSGVPSLIGYGAIAEVATYPVALSPARVTAHFLAVDNVPSAPVYRGLAYSTDNGQTQTNLALDISTTYHNSP